MPKDKFIADFNYKIEGRRVTVSYKKGMEETLTRACRAAALAAGAIEDKPLTEKENKGEVSSNDIA